MLGTKKTTQKSVLGGIGVALLLCLLMALMPMSGFVTNNVGEIDFVDATEESDDYFKLPETIDAQDYEYDQALELKGMRDQMTKAYVTEDGKIAQLVANEPINYLLEDGVWDEIDLNVVATANGWEVTKNTFTAEFAAEVAGGVRVQTSQFVDPIITGINPTVVTIDETGEAPQPLMIAPSNEGPTVGGNVIRYPVAEGFDLDYTVESTQLKQNLVIRERPVLQPNAAWLGISEAVRLPAGYSLYIGDTLLGEAITQTQEALQVRHTETGELLVEFPVPMVVEENAEAPYVATYFVQSYGSLIILTTAVDTDWLLSEDRVFPLAIDPTIKVTSNAGGYCYVYYGNCYASSYRYLYRYYSQFQYLPWHKYTFNSNHALPNGATVDSVSWKQYVTYAYGSSSSQSITATVMEACGTDSIYNYVVSSASCSGAFSASNLASGYGGTAQKKMQSSIYNSAAAATYSQGTGWRTATICSSASACTSSTPAGYITSAQTNSGTIGMGARMMSSIYTYTYAYTGGSSNSYIQIVYSGGTDADAPTSGFTPYSGITSYAEGARTFFTTLTDISGIDTTSANGPKLYYAMNNGTWSSVSATSIGTCSSTSSSCNFKATTPSVNAGDYLEYYWKFQDLNQGSNGANVGYDPALTGAQTTPTPHYFAVDDIVDAGSAQKMTVLTTDVSGGNYNAPTVLDRQMTYYDSSDEYIFEFDTSGCGTGSQACFYTTSYYFYANWIMQWTTAPSTGYNGMGGTRSGLDQLHKDDGGYLTIAAKNGPQYNLIFLYDSSSNSWAMVGLGDKTTSSTSLSIDDTLSGGTAATFSSGYGYNKAYKIAIPGGFTGSFGKFNFNATGSTSSANMLCVTDNGAYYFYRTYSGTGRCNPAYYYFGVYNSITTYKWSGFALSLGYYGQQASGGTITYKVGLVAPQPDTFAPEIDHTALADSHSKDRTVSAVISDAGDPPSGLNVSTTTGVGPTMYYREVGASTWSSVRMTSQSDKTDSQCASASCTWSADIPTQERGTNIEYYIAAQDTSTAATGVNTVTTTTTSFEVGDPNKMMIIEWRDMGYTQTYLCTYQVVMYDVTNEIEFKYDSGCGFYYDYMMTGYQDGTRTKGETMRAGSGSYTAGANIFSNNYRISTSSTSNGHELFDLGIKPLSNANQALVGTSNGNPSAYNCAYQFSSWKSNCAANIDIPDGFAIEYFGTEFNGSDSSDRIHISRHGIMQLINSGSTSTYRSMGSYYSVPPDMPTTNYYTKTNTLAPNYGGYGSYYCYKNTAVDCGVYFRTMPFEGKGTDIESDLTCVAATGGCNWDIADSPIRINPSNDYLSISGDLTIEPGVVVQVAAGKGISFDGGCDSFTANGNITDHILFEGQAGATWAGIAFTDSCSTGTDDRHQFTYVDFANTSDAAIAAGSRHGNTPSSNANVGNFTMNHITFKNVATAFAHGSGQGTVVTMDDFSVEGSSTANTACFNFAEDTVATLTEGTMTNCNTAGTTWGGAIVNYPGSSSGSLFVENVTVTNSYVNFIDVDLQDVTLSNISVTNSLPQSGVAIDSMHGTDSDVYIYNVDADSYANSGINALGSLKMIDVDLGSANLYLIPGGSSSTAVGPSGDNAVVDTLTAGDIQMNRMHPSVFTDITAGDLMISGNAITAGTLELANFAVGNFQLTGCGWSVTADSINADLVYSSCSSSAAPNTVVVSGGTISHTDSVTSALYARNTMMTVGGTAITSSTAGTGTIYLARASTNAQISLIDVTQNTNACADNAGDTSNCDWDAASSATIYFGGTAQASTYRMALVNGVSTQVWKSGHTISASVVDNSGSELFEVGSHVTDMNGQANIWVVTGDSNGNTYDDHNIRAFGPAGQNETMHTDSWYPSSGDFNIGSSIALLLEPAPVDFDQPGQDCAWMALNATTSVMQTSPGIYEFDSTPMTISADLHLDGCTIKLLGSVLKVKSTATSSPVLTLSNGGTLVVTVSPDTGAVGALKAFTSTYGLHLDVQDGGTLEIDGGLVQDVAQDATSNSAILIGDGATLTMMNSATVMGKSASSADMATVKVDGGTVSIDDSTIINTGNTGTALWVEQAGGNINNIVVKNAAIGIQAKNGAPQVDGFTSTDNTVGVEVTGGMSLPTIYRSTLLSGKATGWETYGIDLSTYLGTGNYLQVGANSIYGGGNAHPTYNYATSKYYMMTDRYNIEIEDDAGNSWNITQDSDLGYYPYSSADPASGVGHAASYDGGAGGVPSWHCNYYGYQYGPNNTNQYDGYMYYLWYYWPGGPQSNPGYPGYYANPPQFNFGWENIDGVTPTGNAAYYPYHYLGYYYTTYHGGPAGSTFAPPEGYNGLWSNYNVCLDYAYSYYMNPGQGARLTFPLVDISASNISKVTLWMDVLHNRADNYQDRLDFVARSGNDPADLGNYVRESGTALFKDGVITGSDTGIEIGGDFAAGNFENVEVTNPVNSGMEIVGQTAATVTGLEVTGGTYGVLAGTSASGSIDLLNLNLNGQTSAGIYYVKDISGDLSGTIENSGGAAFKYGALTSTDNEFNSVTIASNAIGVETAGSGTITMNDVIMGNTKDVVISGAAAVDFIEGTIDVNSVEVTGLGLFTRMRELDVTLTADSSAVSGATVNLLDASGAAAGTGVTDSNGQVGGLTFTTATVDNAGVTIPSLAGYEVSTVAKIGYYYTSSTNNLMDFRYAFQAATLTDASGNTETVDLVDQITERVCYGFASVSYQMVAQCTGTLSTNGHRDMDTDGDGVNDGTEYGYYGAMAKDMSGKTVMIDTPYLYLTGGADYEFNGTTILATGGYTYYDTQRWYPMAPYGSSIYMHGGDMFSMMTNPDSGSPMGYELGYQYYTLNVDIQNSTLSGLSTIASANGYVYAFGTYNYIVEEFIVKNNDITHFRGYTDLNQAILWTDICITLAGGGGNGGGAVISGNTFTNCGVGVMLTRSPYYTYHAVDELGADNTTISGNTFNEGGEVADVWIYSQGHADDTVISGNTMNSDAGGHGVAQYAGKNLRTEVSGNIINGADEGIYIRDGTGFVVDNNQINGIGDSAMSGIHIRGGAGDVTDNTLIDADGGIVLDDVSQPPTPGTSLCSIASNSYRTATSCSFTVSTGKTLTVDLETDSWGYEIGIVISKPDGSKDTWNAGSFASLTTYAPLATYTASGSYTIDVTDTFGDGGANIFASESSGATTSQGMDVSGNSIGLSAGRLSPNAVGISATDCDGIDIDSGANTIILSDNAILVENCNFNDNASVLSGDGSSSTNGINSAVGSNTISLYATTISGFDTGVEMPSGTLSLMGDASIAGASYGVHATSATVSAVHAAVDGGSAGTGLYVEDSPDVWVYPLDASGDVGVHIVNSPFRWDGGAVDATTALKVDESVGTVENMTWTSSTQIDAGSNAYITSIGNSLDASKLIVDSTATIDEANLFTMDSTHLTATPTNEVALLIKSTDGTRASYVSTSFQPENMVVDGDDSDWNGGNALNPSGYAMPGVMSGDGTNDMSMTYIEGDHLYFGLTGEDLSNSDLLIYISTDGSGSTTGYNGMGGAHTLPVPANYVLWADSDSSYDLYSYGFLGWGPTSLSSDPVAVDFSGSFAEISIPFSRMGGTPSQVDIVAIVQGESTADVSTVHPTQTIDSQNTLQTFSEYITVELTHNDLLTGSIADEVLVYRTYKGSSTPSVAKDYDVMIKTSADCASDWAVSEDLSMATNANINLDMERACPVIGTSLADITVNEDSGAHTFSLTNMADDVQDDEATMSWTSASSNLVAHDNVLVDWNQNGHQVTITPLDNQFGTMTYSFEVTDSNGLSDSKNITFEVENVNDAPVICNVDELDCMPLFTEDELYNNILPEGFGSHTKFLGDVSNATRSYIRDMANEQAPTRQVYTWGASVPSTCIAFSAEVNAINELILSENTNNELGGTCTVTLTLSDDGAENQAANTFDVEFSVSPVNDAPVILDWNASMTDAEGRTVSVNPDNGSVNSIPWKLSVMEDDTTAANLTFSLAAMKDDIDHNDADLTWEIEPTDQCVYGNYFDATIVGDDLVLDLVPDATTNGFDWEIDYLNDNGIHQIGPTGSDYCQIRLVLRDTATAPSYVPNYDTALMPIADYAQGVATQEIGVRVERVRELVADYGFDEDTGFSFNGVNNIMTGTYVPVTVDVTAGGDEGPYTYDHMLAITYHTDGHSEVEQTRYYAVPAYGTSVAITEDVYITKDTTNVWVEMDVKTCLANPCDILAPASERFQTDSPASHRSNNQGQQGADWSKPGQYGSNATQTSERRPLLEDSNWCNNMMSSLSTAATCAHANQPSSTFEASGQDLPTVVGTIGAGAVPSFAPSIIAVSLAGMFVSALALSGRRDEDEEALEESIVEDELAVSPVIATILMVAITVVLSGVIYVWASSLAETDVKGVPRVTFDIEDINGADADQGHWRISVTQSETDLATQAVEVRVFYVDASGSPQTFTANLADTNDVYGFNPANSDAFVTFVDQVNKEGTKSISTFNTGDEVYVRTHAPDGTPLTDVTITMSYAPANAQGALLRSWSGLAYDLKA